MAALPKLNIELAQSYNSARSSTPPPSVEEGVETDNTRDISHDMFVAGWREAMSSKGMVYYFNVYTRDSVWTLQDATTHQREQKMLPENGPSDVMAAAMAELRYAPNTAPDPPMKNVKGKRMSQKRKFEPDPDQEANERNAIKFAIGGERFATVKLFKGHPYVNIREYYWNEIRSKMLAGKKGLNLNVEQWNQLVLIKVVLDAVCISFRFKDLLSQRTMVWPRRPFKF